MSSSIVGDTSRECDRCGSHALAVIVSMFNLQAICLTCKSAERNHPDYERARAAEMAAVRSGDRDFVGIGLPVDLYPGNG